MSEFLEIVTEFEAKYEERFPGCLLADPPAKVEQLRRAESLLGASLTDELVEFYELHNGAYQYPFWHQQVRLPPYPQGSVNYAAFPGRAGPFDAFHALTVFANNFDGNVHVPLVGERRGEVWRSMSLEVDSA